MSVRVELFRGPFDGMVREADDDEEVIVIGTPPMTAAEFIAAGERPALLEYAVMEPVEHAYVRDHKQRSRAGHHRFIYAGVRAGK